MNYNIKIQRHNKLIALGVLFDNTQDNGIGLDISLLVFTFGVMVWW